MKHEPTPVRYLVAGALILWLRSGPGGAVRPEQNPNRQASIGETSPIWPTKVHKRTQHVHDNAVSDAPVDSKLDAAIHDVNVSVRLETHAEIHRLHVDVFL